MIYNIVLMSMIMMGEVFLVDLHGCSSWSINSRKDYINNLPCSADEKVR